MFANYRLNFNSLDLMFIWTNVHMESFFLKITYYQVLSKLYTKMLFVFTAATDLLNVDAHQTELYFLFCKICSN